MLDQDTYLDTLPIAQNLIVGDPRAAGHRADHLKNMVSPTTSFLLASGSGKEALGCPEILIEEDG